LSLAVAQRAEPDAALVELGHGVDQVAHRTTEPVEAPAAYVHLQEEIPVGGIARTVCFDPAAINGMVDVDLDAEGRIVGVEVMDGSRCCRADCCRSTQAG
jgi:uncharacterized protein YuzE